MKKRFDLLVNALLDFVSFGEWNRMREITRKSSIDITTQ